MDQKDNTIDKDRIAVALKYERDIEKAPKVAASGKGKIAENIIEIAKQNDITIHEDANLAEMLVELEINSFIPIEAYVTVAEILSYIYGKNAEKGNKG